MKQNRIAAPFRLLAAAVIFVALGACKSADTKPADGQVAPAAAEHKRDNYVRVGYACCNLHHEGDWISDSNLGQLPFVPVGTPIKVKSIDGRGYRAYVEIDGKPMRLGLDYGRQAETTEQWVNKIVVPDDPKARLAKFPARTRNAIAKGQLLTGMSREQVIMAVGYPQTDQNPKLDGLYWRYWWSSFDEYDVRWGKGATVGKIDGHPATVGNVTYSGK
jgi:hypothetical protein